MTEAMVVDLAGVEMTQQEADQRRNFWAWVWRKARAWVGWLLAALGALALFLGWFGVSGQAIAAKQIPYLISGGLVGIGLIVMAAVFLATEDWRRQTVRLEDLERKVNELHQLLTVEATAEVTGEVTAEAIVGVATAQTRSTPTKSSTSTENGGAAELVALPTGTTYHRSNCRLVAGKPGAKPVTATEIGRRKLHPCRICEPGQ